MPADLPEQYGQPKDMLEYITALDEASSAGRRCILDHINYTDRRLYVCITNFKGFQHILEPLYTSEKAIPLSGVGNLNDFTTPKLKFKRGKTRGIQGPYDLGGDARAF